MKYVVRYYPAGSIFPENKMREKYEDACGLARKIARNGRYAYVFCLLETYVPGEPVRKVPGE